MNEIKMSSVNKRLLGLIEKLHLLMEPFIKNSKLIKMICSGSENARNMALSELQWQISGFITKKREEIEEERKKKIE